MMGNAAKMFAVLLSLAHCGAAATTMIPGEKTLADNETVGIRSGVVQRWMRREMEMKDAVRSIFKFVAPHVDELIYKAGVSERCLQDLLLVAGGVRNLETWALNMLDASGKLPSGVMDGTLSSFGSYEQCVDISYQKDNSKDQPKDGTLFQGQYCAMNIAPFIPPKPKFYKLDEVLDELKDVLNQDSIFAELAKNAHFFYFLALRVGLCVPSTCRLEDMDKISKGVGEALLLNVSVGWCEVDEPKDFSPAPITVISIFSCIGLVMLIGTGLDIYMQKTRTSPKSRCHSVLLAFSIVTNTRKLLRTDTRNNTSFSCFHGLRFISISWVILGHNYFIVNYQLFRGLVVAKDYAEDLAFQAIANGTVSVDTFFFMSGFLVCYWTVHLVKKMKKPFNLQVFICHRIWRLAPTHMAVVAVSILAPLISRGPIWHETTDWALQNCKKNWWASLLFVNNFLAYDEMCLPHTWYIAADMQLYLVSLFVLLPLLRWPSVGLSINFILVLGSVVVPGVLTFLNGYPPTLLFANPDPKQRIPFMTMIYFMPYTHMGSYFMGMFLAYVLAVRSTVHLRPVVLAVGWSVAITCASSTLYGVFEWNKGKEVTLTDGLLYASLSRLAWAVSITWLVLVCTTGQGGLVNTILSWKAWIPLSRLTFLAYLVHPLVQVAVVGSFHREISPSQYLAVWVYFGNLLVTFAASYLGSLVVESPVLALEKIFLESAVKKDQLESNQETKCHREDMDSTSGHLKPNTST